VNRRTSRRRLPRRRAAQSGYAYFLAFFMITVMMISSEAMLQNIAIEKRREREAEMIWRGNQCIRAIRLYYRKTGHYPQTLDDLQKGLPDLHFLRPAALKDPMNRVDGSWRFIYTNTSGQIIGSVRYATMQQMAMMDLNAGKPPSDAPSAGTAAASSAAATASASQDSGSVPTVSSAPTSTTDAQSQNQQPAQTNANSSPNAPGVAPGATGPGGGLLGGATPGAGATAQLQPTGPVDGPVLGAFLAGVAGGNHYDADSIKTYKSGKTYQQWEFIWNPLEDQARALQNGLSPQQGSGQQPGGAGLPIANPNGGAPTPAPSAPNGAPQPAPGQPEQPQLQ
jgi:hypothetical protein